jgi:hypothetical protein
MEYRVVLANSAKADGLSMVAQYHPSRRTLAPLGPEELAEPDEC